MPITEDRIAKLREFGLSEYASRAYLALLDLGLTEARDISTLSKVPTSKIYHILEQLHERGLCIILPEFPKKYAPVPFGDYLDKLQTQHEEAARAIDKDRVRLEDLFAVAGDVDVGDRGTFTVLRGRRNVLSKVSELTRETSREMFVMDTRGSADRMEFHVEETRDAVDRGVRVRLLVPLDAETLGKLAEIADVAEIRDRLIADDDQGANVSIAIYDNERALIVNYLPDDGHLYQGKDTAFYTDHEAMVAALRSVVEPHWANAPTLPTRRQEIEDGRGREFTRVCASEEEAFALVSERVRDGARSVVALRGAGMSTLPASARPALDALKASGAHVRTAVFAEHLELARTLQTLALESEAWEVRHVDESVASRYWIIDDREAFVSIAHAGGTVGADSSELMVHTSNPKTVKSLRAHFERVWATSRSIDRRVAELEGGDAADEPDTRFLTPSEDSAEAARNVIARAQSVLRVITRSDGLQRFAESPAVKESVDRGVAVRVLANVTTDVADAALAARAFADVRHLPRASLLGNSADGEEVFVVLPSGPTGEDPSDGTGRIEEASVVVHSVDPVYVHAFDGFFEAQWEAAVPVDERLQDLGVDPGPKKPARNVPVK